ncbi:hypothetical protein THF1D04_20310 [Vibrio owensii]|uniref:Uncharacterized protein n=1 Tax=Vibrio owensii TaxID=696485 RepID=A0AAU9Q542_9VIBR|nr:hypothetical protein THF1D04_20310 [Vibrio owensii]
MKLPNMTEWRELYPQTDFAFILTKTKQTFLKNPKNRKYFHNNLNMFELNDAARKRYTLELVQERKLYEETNFIRVMVAFGASEDKCRQVYKAVLARHGLERIEFVEPELPSFSKKNSGDYSDVKW